MIVSIIHWACLGISAIGVLLLAIMGITGVDVGVSPNTMAILATIAAVVAKNPIRAVTLSAFGKGIATLGALAAAALIGASDSGVLGLGHAANWVGIAAVVLGALGFTPLPDPKPTGEPPPPPPPQPGPHAPI